VNSEAHSVSDPQQAFETFRHGLAGLRLNAFRQPVPNVPAWSHAPDLERQDRRLSRPIARRRTACRSMPRRAATSAGSCGKSGVHIHSIDQHLRNLRQPSLLDGIELPSDRAALRPRRFPFTQLKPFERLFNGDAVSKREDADR
jgi:hypothetical protein